MEEAELVPGVEAFVRRCHAQGIPVAIVSHKTRYAGFDETHTNLREAALRWLRAQGLFDPEGMGMRPEQVYFESTRQEKLARIAVWGCTHFVDDLEETFREPSFPPRVEKLLYRPQGPASELPGVITVESWHEIDDHIFSHARH
jgi:hypothetical protein